MRPTASIDWTKTTIPLPYVFQDMEDPIYELSEVFLPGELTSTCLQSWKECFLRFSQLTSNQQQGYNKLTTEPSYNLTYQFTQRMLAQDYVPDDFLVKIISTANNPDELHAALKALVCYMLGLTLVDHPALPLRPDIVVARSLRIAHIDVLFKLLVKLFATEAEFCCQ